MKNQPEAVKQRFHIIKIFDSRIKNHGDGLNKEAIVKCG